MGAGDRIAWGELPAGDLGLVPEVADLLAARTPVRAASQLVHGDLTGNVLFADGLPPAVIDFSPYWRPKALASAVVAVDAVVWLGARRFRPAIDCVLGIADTGVEVPMRGI